MRKSRNIIKNTLRLIVFLLFCIWILECDYFIMMREFVSSILPFFQGRRNFLSNIFIGILCSAMILVFGEMFNYFEEKTILRYKILQLYKKWENEIKLKSEKICTDFDFLNYFTPQMRYFAQEVDTVYNSYLPYFRGGTYFRLIRVLYQLTNTIFEYIDKIEDEKKQRDYCLYCIDKYESLKTKLLENERKDEIEKEVTSLYEQLAILKENKIDKKTASENVSKKHLEVLKISGDAEWYSIINKLKNLDYEDTQMEFYQSQYRYKRLIRQIKRKDFLEKLKSYLPKERKKKREIEKLMKKYSDE